METPRRVPQRTPCPEAPNFWGPRGDWIRRFGRRIRRGLSASYTAASYIRTAVWVIDEARKFLGR
jgi:hypothetical protein